MARIRLSISLGSETYGRLEAEAARQRLTIDQSAGQAIARGLNAKWRPHLTAHADPVLAELWDNEDDAIFDNL